MSTVNAIASGSATASTGKAGLSALTGQDFLKVIINQLQHQDPLNPSSSDQLLSQLSQISALQSNQTLTTSLQGLTLQQSIAAGSNMIGKAVAGVTEAGDQTNGIVNSVKVTNEKVYLELDSGQQLPLGSVTQVAPAQASALAQTLAGLPGGALSGSGLNTSALNNLSASDLQKLLANLKAA